MKKYSIFDRYDFGALVAIMIATSIRVILISLGWPSTNSDEATMGLMALHIAYQGAHPLFMYGQDYMGSIESHIGAALFLLLGPSLFALRLGLILLDIIFFFVMYRLTRLLYTRGMALFVVFLLCFGSTETMLRQLKVLGGAVETMLFGALLLLIATSLTLSARPYAPMTRHRTVLYACFGLVMGLGMWSHLLVLPFVGAALLLLIAFCRREMHSWTWMSLIAGFLLGFSPTIIYDIQYPLQNAIGAFWQVHSSGGTVTSLPYTLWDQIRGTVLISLPAATGFNPCNIPSDPGAWRHAISSCMLAQGSWGIGYLILMAIALVFAAGELSRCYRVYKKSQGGEHAINDDGRRTLVYAFARAMLLIAGGFTLVAFLFSAAPALVPVTSARYLVGLTVMLPALLAPLWTAVSSVLRHERFTRYTTRSQFMYVGGAFASGVVLLLLVVNYTISLVAVFQQVPSVQTINQQQSTMVNDLLHAHLTHIYTDYWTCNRVIFQSDEHIICSVLDEQLQQGQNRYFPYQEIVETDPRAAYVFQVGSPQALALAQRNALQGTHYRVTQIDGYMVYQPT